ncbi:MAG: thiamine phosphate synthase [Eubacterium sp.]|nr:thiamine phosphate synthase [Eubacterium sp.]
MTDKALDKNPYKNMIAITNRHLVKGDFLAKIERVIKASPRAIILREKDLSHEEYEELLDKIVSLIISSGANKKSDPMTLYIHSHIDMVAKYCFKYSGIGLHLPYHVLVEKSAEILDMKNQNKISISVSCHSIDEVSKASGLHADQVILGNIFETDCKKGLPGKGLKFLEEAVLSTTIPVYGIGGITEDNLPLLLERGGAGGCMMSGFMK